MTSMTANPQFWDNLAEKYAAQPVKDEAAFERKKAVTRGLLEPEATVFEIGCGTGSLALSMAPFARHIHAMDVSPEMIHIANDKKTAQGATNISFHVGTLDGATPFSPAQFDAAWAYSILHLVEDRRGTSRRSSRSSSRGATSSPRTCASRGSPTRR